MPADHHNAAYKSTRFALETCCGGSARTSGKSVTQSRYSPSRIPCPRSHRRIRVLLKLDQHVNFFDHVDTRLFEALVRGEYNITGLRNKDLQQQLPELSSGVISRALKRLRLLGLVKRLGRTYKYDVTQLGCAAITAGLMLKQLFLVPALDTASVS